MTSLHHQSNSPGEDSIEATAAAWLAQRDGGFTVEEEAEFARWLQADERHAAAVARLEIAWSSLLQLRNFRPEAQRHPDRDLLAHQRPRASKFWPALAGAVAAAAVLTTAILWKTPRWVRSEPAPIAQNYPSVENAGQEPAPPVAQHYATTEGGYQRVSLSDGSVVELNASSEVSVRYTAAERRLQLLRGEAHFTVAKNKQRPFWVQAGAVSVRAVGTAFDVRLSEQAVEVLVTEGRVQVMRGSPLSGKTMVVPTTPSGEIAILVAGQLADVPLEAFAPLRLSNAPPEAIYDALAWQEPRLVFADTPLAEVIEQFNRHNAVQLVLDNPNLGELPVGGSFRAENVEAFVRLLTRGGEIAATRRDADHIVLHRAR